MDHLDIQASLKKVDRRFTEELTSDERKAAVRQFKRLYAEEMAKIADELSKRTKVQENIYNINIKERDGAREFDEELRRKMEKHVENREKLQESKQKEHRMQEDNWRRKHEEITRKNRLREREAFQKAQRMRREVEEFWIKKGETVQLKESSLRHNPTTKPSGSLARESIVDRRESQTLYSPKKKLSFKVNFPNLTRSKINRVDFEENKFLNKSVAESSLNEDIRSHQERSIRGAKEEEGEKLRSYLEKLKKIEVNRKNVQQRIEKEVKESKRLRQLKENPETLALNRKRSIEQFGKSKKKGKREGSGGHMLNSGSVSKKDLDASIYEHLQSKKRLEEQQFHERQASYEQSKRKMKQTRINRLIKETIGMIKHQSLADSPE